MITNILVNLFRQIANNLEDGTCKPSEEDLTNLCKIMKNLDSSRQLSKAQACAFMNMSRSTFDSWIEVGMIPKGNKESGFKELSWAKIDLELAKEEIKKLKRK